MQAEYAICFAKKKERQMRKEALQQRTDNDKEKEENRQTEQNNLQRGVVSVTNYKACGYQDQEGLV